MLGVVVELPGWVQQMMGHETPQMIHDKYYSHIKNYQREDGSAFMEKFYEPTMELTEDVSKSDKKYENFTPVLHQKKNRELVVETNSPKSLKK